MASVCRNKKAVSVAAQESGALDAAATGVTIGARRIGALDGWWTVLL